jgi:hypothetical protein
VMRERPRDPRDPLLDPPSLHFILVAGIFKALVGGALLVALPRYGYGLGATRTLLFLYMTVGQLVFVYPSRRVGPAPGFNVALHLSVILCTGLQLLTILLPGLRTLLGLEYPGLAGLAWVAAAIMLSWGTAEAYARMAAPSREWTA